MATQDRLDRRRLLALGVGVTAPLRASSAHGRAGLFAMTEATPAAATPGGGGTATVPGPVEATFVVAPDGDDANPGSAAAPFRTVARARDAVRGLKQTGPLGRPVTVSLRGGRYELPEPLVFDARDSGTPQAPVTYAAAPGETPVLSGGRRIEGWRPETNGVFAAAVGALRFRQLYVDGGRATLARTPNAGSYLLTRPYDVPGRTLVLDGGDLAGQEQAQALVGAEIVVQSHWAPATMRVASAAVEGTTVRLVVVEPERGVFFDFVATHQAHQPPYTAAYHLQNSRAMLDAGGEWFLDRDTGTLRYKPEPGQDLGQAVVVAPTLEALVRVQGTAQAPAEHLAFVGLTLAHTTWLSPDVNGYVTLQAVREAGAPDRRLPGVIHLEDTAHVRLEHNTVRQGGGNGIVLVAGTQETAVVGNLVTDVAGNGIVVESLDQARVSRRDAILDNTVTRVGQDFFGAVGIFAGYTDGLRVEHNEVAEVPYTGISAGWGWGSVDLTRDSVIRANRVHHAMRLLDDGAGIYTLGPQPGSRIERNHLHDITRSAWAVGQPRQSVAGIYLDEGSDGLAVTANVLERCDTGVRFHRTGPTTVVSDNMGQSLGRPVADGGAIGPEAMVSSDMARSPAITAEAGPRPPYAGRGPGAGR